MSTRNSSIEARLVRLERQNKHLKIVIATTVTIAMSVLLFTGSSRREDGRIFQAEKFILTDGAGKQRAIFGIDNQEAVLRLSDDQGHPRLSLHEDELRGFDAKGNTNFVLTNDRLGGAALSLFRDGYTKRIKLGFAGSNPSPQLSLSDDINHNLDLSVDDGGTHVVLLYNDRRISLGTSSDKKIPSMLNFWHQKGDCGTVLTGSDPELSGNLYTYGKGMKHQYVWPVADGKIPRN